LGVRKVSGTRADYQRHPSFVNLFLVSRPGSSRFMSGRIRVSTYLETTGFLDATW
jgi:hypothetical protein